MNWDIRNAEGVSFIISPIIAASLHIKPASTRNPITAATQRNDTRDATIIKCLGCILTQLLQVNYFHSLYIPFLHISGHSLPFPNNPAPFRGVLGVTACCGFRPPPVTWSLVVVFTTGSCISKLVSCFLTSSGLLLALDDTVCRKITCCQE